MVRIKWIGYILLLFLFQSCVPSKKLYLFHDQLPNVSSINVDSQKLETVLKRGDRLAIVVSLMDPTQSAFFNSGGGNQSSNSLRQYIIRADGTIDFPMLGRVKLQGLTVRQAADTMMSGLKLFFNEPFVNIIFFGKVFVYTPKTGGTVDFFGERLTIFEALSQLGSISAFDQRDKIWLVREENNERKFVQLNINSKEIFNSPYYYLQANDFIYVRPSIYSSAFGQGSLAGFVIAAVGTLSTLLLIINWLNL
jgi:polysaccharide export outer membrane protein